MRGGLRLTAHTVPCVWFAVVARGDSTTTPKKRLMASTASSVRLVLVATREYEDKEDFGRYMSCKYCQHCPGCDKEHEYEMDFGKHCEDCMYCPGCHDEHKDETDFGKHCAPCTHCPDCGKELKDEKYFAESCDDCLDTIAEDKDAIIASGARVAKVTRAAHIRAAEVAEVARATLKLEVSILKSIKMVAALKAAKMA